MFCSEPAYYSYLNCIIECIVQCTIYFLKKIEMSLTAFLPPWLCIAIWISLGYSMILYYKLILSSWNFNYPFFLILCHTVLATILTQILARFAPSSLMNGVHEGKVKWKDFFIKIFPYVFCSCSSLVLSNKVYIYIFPWDIFKC